MSYKFLFKSLIMMSIKKLVSVWIITFTGFISNVHALALHTFWRTEDTAVHKRSQVEWTRSFLDIISLVNSYLWFAIWFFCFIFMIRNGYKLIIANWDEKAMKSAKTALLWSAVWLTVSLLAYIIVNIAVKLF